MVSAVVAGVVGVVLAVNGAGVSSLVVQALVQSCISLALILAFTRWRPGWSFSGRVTGEFALFGGPVVGIQFTQVLRDRGDQLLLGAILGLDALGLWAIATRILSAVEDLSIALVDFVAFPVFVKIRDDHARLSRAYGAAVTTSESFLVPIMAVVAVTAPVLIPAVFGPQWTEATLPTQILCLCYAIYGLSYLIRPMLRSAGKVGIELAFVVASLGLHLAVMALAAPHGLTVVAIVFALEAAVNVVVGAWLLSTRVAIASPVPRQSLVTMLCGAGAAAAGFGVEGLGHAGSLVHAALTAGATAAVFGVGMLVLNRPVVVELAQDARRLVGRPG